MTSNTDNQNRTRTGQCLCGAIKYSLTGASAKPYYNTICHCVNCRRVSTISNRSPEKGRPGCRTFVQSNNSFFSTGHRLSFPPRQHNPSFRLQHNLRYLFTEVLSRHFHFFRNGSHANFMRNLQFEFIRFYAALG